MSEQLPIHSFVYDPKRREIGFEDELTGEILFKQYAGAAALEELLRVVEDFAKGETEEGAFICPGSFFEGREEAIVYLRRDGGGVRGKLIPLPWRSEDQRTLTGNDGEELKRLRHFLDTQLNNLLYELRNSFSQIQLTINLIEMKERSRLSKEMRNNLREIREEVDYALNNVEKSSRRIKSLFEEMPLNRRPVNIGELIKGVFERQEDLLKMKEVGVKIHCVPPKMVLLDESLMKSALEALVELIYFNVEVGSEVTVFCEKFREEALQIVISYAGEAMELPGGETYGEIGGTHRGEFFYFRYEFLKSVVEKHGGKVHVESMMDVGSTIFIELPVEGGMYHEKSADRRG